MTDSTLNEKDTYLCIVLGASVSYTSQRPRRPHGNSSSLGRSRQEKNLPDPMVRSAIEFAVESLSPRSRHLVRHNLTPKSTLFVGYARSDLTLANLREKVEPYLKASRESLASVAHQPRPCLLRLPSRKKSYWRSFSGAASTSRARTRTRTRSAISTPNSVALRRSIAPRTRAFIGSSISLCRRRSSRR